MGVAQVRIWWRGNDLPLPEENTEIENSSKMVVLSGFEQVCQSFNKSQGILNKQEGVVNDPEESYWVSIKRPDGSYRVLHESNKGSTSYDERLNHDQIWMSWRVFSKSKRFVILTDSAYLF